MLNTRAWPLQVWDHNSCGCLRWACGVKETPEGSSGVFLLGEVLAAEGCYGGITAFRGVLTSEQTRLRWMQGARPVCVYETLKEQSEIIKSKGD